MDKVLPLDTLLAVDANCASPPVFVLSASLIDENTYEKVEVRWFVDYDPATAASNPAVPPVFIDGPADGVTVERTVAPIAFKPYGYDPAGSEQAFRDGGGLHVVELVVSNSFAPEPVYPAPPLSRPWRTPLTTSTQQFETQYFRWVFHYVPTGTAGALCGYAPP
jgi:hypothetical protein